MLLMTRLCSVLIYAAPDLPDVWIAHTLDCDVVTQGDSPESAFQMALEATAMFVGDEVARGADPFATPAPPEDWEKLARVLVEGRTVDNIEGLERHIVIAGQMVVRVHQPDQAAPSPERTAVPWMGLQATAA